MTDEKVVPVMDSSHPDPGSVTLRLGLGDALVGLGALLVILFSFAPFIQYDDADLLGYLTAEQLPTWFSAWSLESFLAPLTWWVVFAAVGLLALVGLRFVLPWDWVFVGFRVGQLQVCLSLFGFLVLLGYALSAKTLIYGTELQNESGVGLIDAELSFGWGGIVMLLGAAIAVFGAVLDHLGVGRTIWSSTRSQ